MRRACTIDGCSKLVRGHGWCPKHYSAWRRHGDPLGHAPTAEERFWSRVDKTGDCWLWTGARNTAGYGHLRVNGPQAIAHRFAYELLVGPIPAGLHLDHLCRNHGCVNPAHLEPVTCRENLMRGEGFAAVNAAKTHCPRNHEYDLLNTYFTSDGKRMCRTCRGDKR